MSIVAINGSPRKNWNTATLLKNALAGAALGGAGTELVHLYDLNFQGCTSCFACKLKGGSSYGRCAMVDDLTPLLERIAAADALILGSPIYFGSVSGEMKSFLERLMFPYLTYTRPPGTLFRRRMPTAFIYTMNVPETLMQELGYDAHIRLNETALGRVFGQAESFCCFETLQFEDYDRMVFSYCDPEERRERHRTVFPVECREAFELGRRLAAGG